MVYAEQLSEFLGIQLNLPLENIARMQNGVLYINLVLFYGTLNSNNYF